MDRIDIQQVLNQMRTMAAQAQSGPADPAPGESGEVSFGQLLKSSIDQVNETQQKAGELSRAFEMGDRDANLAEVMVALQKSSVSFQAMVQVRNKLVEAYKDVMNMPL